MRPIKLIFRGLNSFEKEQKIDFNRLTAAGLFGIFGPTGSGKSTIIDACTMALYSEMSRQSGRECINTSCDEMYVCLEFETHNVIYVVERVYSNDKKGLKQKRARLYKLTGSGRQIISDKPKEINGCIIELIGLNYNDFSRSVVLPQGKFSEFLMLGERDRSDMLERIFGLEEYGDKFMKRLKAVKRDYETGLMIVENSLLSFENVSVDVLQHAEAQLLEDSRCLSRLKEELTEISKTLDEKKKLHGYIKEYEDYKRKLTQQLDISRETENKRELFAIAVKAAAIKPFIESDDKTCEQIARLKTSLQKISGELVDSEKKLLKAQELADRLSVKKDTELPGLIELEVKINQALELDKELEAAKKERLTLLGEYKTVAKEKEVFITAIESKNLQSGEIRSELERLTVRKSEINITPERRHDIVTAYGLALELKKLKKAAAELHNKRIKINLELERSKVEINGTTKSIELLYIERISFTQKLDELKLQKPEAKEISELKKTLRKHTPCPVCGSTFHPYVENGAVTSLNPGDMGEWERESAEYEKKLAEITEGINAANIKKSALNGRHEGYEAQAAELLREEDVINPEIAGLELKLEQYCNKLDKKDISALYDGLAGLDKENAEINKREISLRKCEETLAAETDKLRSEIAARQGELDKILAVGNEKGERIQKISQQLNALIAERNPTEYLLETREQINGISKKAENAKAELISIKEHHQSRRDLIENERAKLAALEDVHEAGNRKILELLAEHGIPDRHAVSLGWLEKSRVETLKIEIESYDNQVKELKGNINRISLLLNSGTENESSFSYAETGAEVKELEKKYLSAEKEIEQRTGAVAVGSRRIEIMRADLVKLEALRIQKKSITHKLDLANDLDSLFRGNEFVKYISKQHLRYITHEASRRMKEMTAGRYAIELDDTDFIIRDDFNGGSRRSPRTLSGGETFMVSLCLALALSSKLQLKNRAPLEFFFLDEGFGTLDSKILDVVMSCLEGLRSEHMSVGIISHVEELKSRVPTKLNVYYDADTGGSRVEHG